MLTAPIETPTLAVRELVADGTELKLSVVAGAEGLDAVITSSRIQKPGLAFAGAYDFIHSGRVQILGKSEIEFAQTLSSDRRFEVMSAIAARRPACFLMTSGQTPLAETKRAAEEAGVAFLATALSSSVLIDRLTHFLEDRLAPRTQIHGVLLDIYGLGVLIRGESGLGKSEAALDLVVRGHRLIADDVVRIRRIGNSVLIGNGPELLRHHMELRGLGIINVKNLFGVAAVRNEKAIDMAVDLVPWGEAEIDRLGLDSDSVDLLDVSLPRLAMPVAPGRSMAILIEVASRNRLLVMRGYHAAHELRVRVEEERGDG